MAATRASVIITTRNRKEELRVALSSVLQQTCAPELIVIDDGSSDGTAAMMMAEFPTAKFFRHEESRGLITRRNQGAQLASGEIIFSIDDDAEFSTPGVVEQTLRDFDDPRIGAVAIPFLEPRKANRLLQCAPDATGTWIADVFIGTAHALRRDIFLSLGGYRDHLVHQGEETDYCVRMLEAGSLVRLGRSAPIKHWESPKRDLRRMDFYGSRNMMLFVWQNVPALYIPARFAAAVAGIVVIAIRVRRPFWLLWGMLCGCALYFAKLPDRQPVKRTTFRLFRRLIRKGPLRLDECGACMSESFQTTIER